MVTSVEDLDERQLRDQVREHLAAVGVRDADELGDYFVSLVHASRATTPPQNDAFLWASFFTAPRCRAITSTPKRDSVSRQLVAIVRRLRQPHRRTWAPGDPIPTPAPERMADLDGHVWVHQESGNGTYRLNAEDRELLEGLEYEGVQVWPFLLEAEGPFTEVLDESPAGEVKP